MKVRRPSGALIASILVHVVVLGLFVQAVFMERPLWNFLGTSSDNFAGERVEYVVLPDDEVSMPQLQGPQSDNQSGEPASGPVAPVPPPIVPPSTIPTSIPPVPIDTTPTPSVPGPTTGPLVGGQGNARGVQPRYTGPELWKPPTSDEVARAPKARPKTPAEQLDSVIGQALARHNDSVADVASKTREPGDWTFEKNGEKYGIDRKFIRLGPVAIPTSILALLPLNTTNNPTTTERDRRNSAMQAEIANQAQRRINEADFQRAVRAIRERKERERKEQEEQESRAKK